MFKDNFIFWMHKQSLGNFVTLYESSILLKFLFWRIYSIYKILNSPSSSYKQNYLKVSEAK
uniref:Uncharacterized protein n=1 Tax=Meloidogyne enterolobii TaxID=390850 RepID=A0A6V7UEX5_MELEN|nr:unnamed protein product [Meloidogyne enterolobii]